MNPQRKCTFTASVRTTEEVSSLLTYSEQYQACLESKPASVCVCPFKKRAIQVGHHVLGVEGRWFSGNELVLSEE